MTGQSLLSLVMSVEATAAEGEEESQRRLPFQEVALRVVLQAWEASLLEECQS